MKLNLIELYKMNILREQMKYGHSSGHSDFCYTSDGSKIISCGSDGDIRVWNGISDNDPTTTCVGNEWARSIKLIGEYIYCSTDDCKVQVLTYPNLERQSVLIIQTAPVNHIVASSDNKFAAICSEDTSINLINLDTNEKLNFYGLNGVGLSIAICPNMEFLAITSSEGKLLIYKITDQSILKEIICNYKCTSFNNCKSLARIQFEPVHGKELAYPDNDAVYIIDVTNWDIKKALTCMKLEGTLFSIIEYSPCGRKLAASTANGDIVVWYVHSGTVIALSLVNDKSGCTALCWNPTNNGQLLYSDKTGRFGIININASTELSLKQNKAQANRKHILSTNDMDIDQDIDDGDDVANDIVDDRSEDELNFTKVASDDDDSDDENVVSIDKLKKKYMGYDRDETDKDATGKRSRSPSPRPRTPETPLQVAFMPTSSPEHLDRRYMCWNHVAVIRCYNAASEQDGLDALTIAGKSIEVEFHDSTFHTNITMPNLNDFTMASISESVLVTANNKQLQAMPLSASTKKWAISIRDPESIICLSTSDNMICVATDSNLLHVYTVYGNQKSVFAAPGPIVTMSSHGHYLLVAYHQSGVRGNDQIIGIMLMKFEGMNMDCRYLNAPLTPGSTLKWLGFSDKGSPGTFDSQGILFLYHLQSNVWIPFLDTKLQFSSPCDTLFLTSVHESTATIRGTKCRSGVYPVFVPRPALLELPLQPPFVELSADKGAFESNLFMWSSLKVDDTDKKFKETALKSFALSCKLDIDLRAFELVENLRDPQIVNLAIKYATKMQRKRLVEKLMQIETATNEDENFVESIISKENNTIEVPNSKARVLKPKENTRIMLSQKKRHHPEKISAQEAKKLVKESNEDISQDLFCTPTEETQNVQTLTANTEEIVETPIVAHQKLPFLKGNKQECKTYNPLSLTDTFAGIGKLDSKFAEKRKKPEDISPPLEAKQEKQRKLDRFMFSKQK